MPFRALVRRPSEEIQNCQLTYLGGRDPIDVERALTQHAAYVEALEQAGVDVTVLEPLGGYPDSCFVEDMAVVLDEVVVVGHSGAVGRRGEMRSVVDQLPEDRTRIHLPEGATLDGGDVLRVNR